MERPSTGGRYIRTAEGLIRDDAPVADLSAETPPAAPRAAPTPTKPKGN